MGGPTMRLRRGMTLIEMVIVIAIIATLAAILFPVFARARERARCQSCMTNLLNIGLAVQLYATDHGGRYPPTEDDLSPLADRYLRNTKVFECPTLYPGIPMGAPANAALYEEQAAVQPPAGPPMGPGGPMPGAPPGMPPPAPPPMTPVPEPVPTEPALTTTYYYRAGHTRDEAPSAPIVADHSQQAATLADGRSRDDLLPHAGRANVLFSDGHLERVDADRWLALGFRPLAESWPPPGTPPGASGPPGMGGMGMGGELE